MSTVFDLSPQTEKELQDVFGADLKRVALEALAVVGYHSGKLSLTQVRGLLGFEDRWQTEQWLGECGAEWNYFPEDLETDRKTLAALFADQH